jgi:hypothetical protein
MARHGVSFAGGGLFQPKPKTFLAFGAYLAMFGSLLMMGRRYYSQVFRKPLLLPATDEPGTAAVWGARVFLVGVAGMTAMLCGVGVDWQIALAYTALTVILFVVMSRILAETGAFFIQAWWFPCAALAGLFGAKALNPQTALILMCVTTVLMVDPREALMPFMVNSLKLLDLRRIRLGRSAGLCALALVIGLIVAIPVTLYFQYDRGMNQQDGWATRMVPSYAFDETVRQKQRLIAQGTLDQANAVSGWNRFAHMAPNVPCMLAFGSGAALVLLCVAGRLRFSRWPLHPVLFLIWTSYPAKAMAASFLIGWMIKVAVARYGGAGGYNHFKPLMFGLIAGDMLGGVIPMIIGLIDYLLTGTPPPQFLILPG